jgi:hypothetical protein
MRYLIFILLLLPILSGCGNNPQGRVAIRGDVTYDGKPLEEGDILFLSVEGTTPAVTTGSPIKDGKFSLSAEHGLIPDQTYSVRFRSIELVTGKENDPSIDPRLIGKPRNILPSKYEVNSIISVTATKKSPNVFKFDLTSDSGK